MNRLTFKSHSKNGTEYYRYAHKWKRIGNTNISTSNKYSQITQKLGKLEDIEQELGIPLEVLFKALKDGIYIIDVCEIICLNYTEISLHYNGVQWLWETPYGAKIFTHYKITWALTKEELEND